MLLNIFLIILIAITIVILFLVIRFQIWKIKENRLGWRTRPLGRDNILYQEKIEGEWKGIKIDGELLLHGKVSRIIYFKTDSEWVEYPKWARDRKKIIQRVKINYPPQRTEYENG